MLKNIAIHLINQARTLSSILQGYSNLFTLTLTIDTLAVCFSCTLDSYHHDYSLFSMLSVADVALNFFIGLHTVTTLHPVDACTGATKAAPTTIQTT